MSFSLKRLFYERLPEPLKAPFGWIPFGLLAGKAYRRVLRDGARFDAMPRNEILVYQERALGDMLRFAVDQVPAYQSLRGAVERLRPLEALKAFAPITKQELQDDFERHLPRDLAQIPHYECTTGGTSGNQLRVLLDNDSHGIEMAFMHRQWARVGYTTRSRKATFRGVAFHGLRDGVYWQHNPIYRELQFSPFHMSERTLGAYVEQLRRFRPEFLHGYPSAIILLAEYLERHGEKLGAPLKAVLLASEGMYPGQRETLERVFACRPFSWYGHSERLILAGECTAEPGVLHHFPDYGILEIVGETGNTLHEDGVRGELVGTGLWNRSLPLIRYRTEDTARLRAPRCACGRCFDRFDQVEGRWRQEYIIGKTGARISPSALNMHGPIFQEVVRYQYYQNRPGSIELRVMTTGRFADTDANAIRSAFLQKVGGELDIALRVVEDIPLTARGKLRRLIQELPGERALKDKEAP